MCPFELFGRHVARRPHHLVCSGQRILLIVISHDTRETKVGDLYRSVGRNQDVLGLDVAMDNAFVVCVLQSIAEVRHDRQRMLGCQLASFNDVSKCRTINKFHQKVVGVFDVSEFVDGHNVGVTQFCQRPSFPRETKCKFDVVTKFFWQNFQRDQTVESCLTGLVDGAHAASTNQLEDFQRRKKFSKTTYGRRLEHARPLITFVERFVDGIRNFGESAEVFLLCRRLASPPSIVNLQHDEFGQQHISLVG
ncbi:hypothetical protein RMSM_03347 [Rhodopirellula maiorica SM1]|uniref:Uncharacterized protein n=1 Tax=Rhodopirellula maiorica SM1 TaxID=1265738 RepID=M5RK83_9BACT|nr:hypothetical protein RMSM_03347 [Rhodopirellula maiorica SM1]